MQIIAGSYERLLYGLKVTHENEKYDIQPIFIYPSHISSIKAVASGGRFMASGSTDEHIKIYDLKLRKEVGSFLAHEGSITALSFHQKSHLISAAEDGIINVYRSRDWELLKSLKEHRGAVNALDIHSTGKVLLSCGQDRSLRCWDLVKGQCVKSLKVPKAAEKILWCPDDAHFLTLCDRTISVYSLESNNVLCQWNSKLRTNAVRFATIEKNGQEITCIVSGGEDKIVYVHDLKGTLLGQFDSGHDNRIKDLLIGTLEDKIVLVTCSTDGSIRLWDLKASMDLHADYLAEYQCGCRIICLALAHVDVQESIHDTEPIEEIIMKPKARLIVEDETQRKRNKHANL